MPEVPPGVTLKILKRNGYLGMRFPGASHPRYPRTNGALFGDGPESQNQLYSKIILLGIHCDHSGQETLAEQVSGGYGTESITRGDFGYLETHWVSSNGTSRNLKSKIPKG